MVIENVWVLSYSSFCSYIPLGICKLLSFTVSGNIYSVCLSHWLHTHLGKCTWFRLLWFLGITFLMLISFLFCNCTNIYSVSMSNKNVYSKILSYHPFFFCIYNTVLIIHFIHCISFSMNAVLLLLSIFPYDC